MRSRAPCPALVPCLLGTVLCSGALHNPRARSVGIYDLRFWIVGEISHRVQPPPPRLRRTTQSTQRRQSPYPGGVLKIASKLIPKKAADALQEKGIDIDEIIKLSENPEAHGALIEVEEHDENERIVIGLE